jgi:hypothetical protein
MDYDAPRRPAVEFGEEGVDQLQARRVSAQSAKVDLDEADSVESVELPGADLSDEELSVAVVPMRADEFRCTRCFLVHHRSQLSGRADGQEICRDCYTPTRPGHRGRRQVARASRRGGREPRGAPPDQAVSSCHSGRLPRQASARISADA